MPDLWNDLLTCLNLLPADDNEQSAKSDVLVFEGSTQQLEYHRLFGGQILGQFIRAAGLTCPDKAVKSLHTVFAREGRAGEPVRDEAILHHQGRSFATLAITARQSAKVLAITSVCMHVPEEGPDRQTIADIPGVLGADHRIALGLVPWETRSADDLDDTARDHPNSRCGCAPRLSTRSGAGPNRLCHRPHPHRYRIAASGGLQSERQRHGVYLRRHIPHRLVPPAFPHRSVVTAAPAQSADGAWPMLWFRRRLHRTRVTGRFLRPRGVAPLSVVTGPTFMQTSITSGSATAHNREK